MICKNCLSPFLPEPGDQFCSIYCMRQKYGLPSRQELQQIYDKERYGDQENFYGDDCD